MVNPRQVIDSVRNKFRAAISSVYAIIGKIFSWFYRKSLIYFVGVIAASTGLLLVARIILSFFSGGFVQPAVGAVGILVVFYVIFLLEGLVVSGGVLKESDEVFVREHAKKTYPRNVVTIDSVSKSFRTNYEAFLTGQQIITIVMIMLLDRAMDWVAVPTQAEVSKRAPYIHNGFVDRLNYLHSGAGDWLILVTQNPVSTFLMTSFFLCWVSQLAPGFLADKREIGFTRIRGADVAMRLGQIIHGLQLGYPGVAIKNTLIKLKYFQPIDSLGVSPSQAYKFFRDYNGIAIESLYIDIEISPSTIFVSERAEYEVESSRVRAFRHIIRCPRDEPPASIEPITGYSSDKEFIKNEVVIESDTRVADFGGGTIFVFDVNLSKSAGPKKLGLKFDYLFGPPKLDRDRMDTFIFEIGKPTRCLEINITWKSELYIPPPSLEFFTAEEFAFGLARPSHEKLEPSLGEFQWKFRRAYPTMGTFLELRCDVRKDMASRWA